MGFYTEIVRRFHRGHGGGCVEVGPCVEVRPCGDGLLLVLREKDGDGETLRSVEIEPKLIAPLVDALLAARDELDHGKEVSDD